MARLALTLGALVALGPLTIDMYLPGPADHHRTTWPTTSAAVQLTLTGTLVGLALGQLLIGPLSDALGRRRPLLAGTALHVWPRCSASSPRTSPCSARCGCCRASAPRPPSVVAMAIVRDLFAGRAAATMLSRLILVMGAAPVLAPTSAASCCGSRRGAASSSSLAVVRRARCSPLGAFGAAARRCRRSAGAAAASRRRCGPTGGLFRDRTYVGLVLVAGLAMAALFAYVSGSSFVFQEQFGLDEQQFGLLFGAGAVWLIAATQLNPRAAAPLVAGADPVAGAVARARPPVRVLLALAATGTGGLLGVLLPLWVVLFAAGLALPNAPGARPVPARGVRGHGGRAARRRPVRRRCRGVARWSGCSATTPSRWAWSSVAALVLAVVVLVVVVRPWQLPESQDGPAPALAH